MVRICHRPRSPHRAVVAGVVLASLGALGGCVRAPQQSVELSPQRSGVLIMAHGGSDDWNSTVTAIVSGLGDSIPVTVAFGMADRASLQDAVSRLEAEGVGRIAIVRLFVSAHSFRERTEFLLGLRHDPSPTGHADHGSLTPIARTASVVLSDQGLSESPRMGAVLADRVRALSVSPPEESVLILAHGMGDDSVNRGLHADIDRLAEHVRALAPFRSVRVETLREDWEEKRASAEQAIRAFVKAGNRDGGRVIVVPFRVAGFGPYRDVLDGLDYVADEQGLLPHLEVSLWVEEQVRQLLLDR